MHVFVYAVARTLARNPDLHKLVAGDSIIHPASVDVCVSVAGEWSVTPVVIINDAANKDIGTIADELITGTPRAVSEAGQMIEVLQRWGRVVPFAICRRLLMRFLLRRLWYRRKISGTFQISCVPLVDTFAPLRFNTAGVLGIGMVQDKVVAVENQPMVQQMVTLTCCLDHSMWNGMEAARFLVGIRKELDEFTVAEASSPSAVH
jgi:pyruvate/2-oxoglutarate dehydrogenase complex dihydrolipoamide acyltransferase (E2) component